VLGRQLPALVSQRNPAAHWSSLAQEVRHAVAPHAKGEHCWACCGAQTPWLLQALVLATPFAQEEAPHGLPSGNTQAAVFVPLHVPAQSADFVSHGECPVRGAPLTGTHLPGFAPSLQASHCPPQELSQQTPSAQNSPGLHSETVVHLPPASLSAWQALLMHALPAVQSSVTLHLVGHVSAAPSHR
jgi:hypothetical protein